MNHKNHDSTVTEDGGGSQTNNHNSPAAETSSRGSSSSCRVRIRIPAGPDPVPLQRVRYAMGSSTGDGRMNDGDIHAGQERRDDGHSGATTGIALINNEERCVTCQVQLNLNDDGGDDWTLQTLNIHGEPTTSPRWYSRYEYTCWSTTRRTILLAGRILHSLPHARGGRGGQSTPRRGGSDAPTTTSTVDGNNDGSRLYYYRLRFTASPMNYSYDTPSNNNNNKRQPSKHKQSSSNNKPGHLSVHFQYTAGIGSLPPPVENVVAQRGLQSHVLHSPQPPATTTDHSSLCAAILSNLSHYDHVWAFGDSVLEQLVTSDPSKQNIRFGNKVAQPLQTATVSNLLQLLSESFPPD